MSFIESQRQKQIQFSKDKDLKTGGIYKGKTREFVLEDGKKNLHKFFRDDAIRYFHEKEISWWDGGKDNLPTGHLLSSQVACVNHLFPMRTSKKLADAFLKSLDMDFEEAISIKFEEDDLFLAFEKTAKDNLGGERGRKRGANSTSIDAFMIGKKCDGQKVLILIEWKYTESYQPTFMRLSSKKTDRLERYFDLLPVNGGKSAISLKPELSLVEHKDAKNLKFPMLNTLCFEPYYQLMRQTLLGEQMVAKDGYAVDDFLHLHLIPEENQELHGVESDKIPLSKIGMSLEKRWKNCLSIPDRYELLYHENIFPKFKKIAGFNDEELEWYQYLEERYLK